MTLKSGLGVRQGHWTCHYSIERIRLPIDILYRNYDLSRVVSEIFNVDIRRDLEIRVRGHSRSLKVVPFDRLCMVNFAPKTLQKRYSTCNW